MGLLSGLNVIGKIIDVGKSIVSRFQTRNERKERERKIHARDNWRDYNRDAGRDD